MKNYLEKIKRLKTELFDKFKSLSFKKKIAVIIVVTIALIISWQTFANITRKPPYTLTKATVENLSEIVSETGNIVTNGKTEVFSVTNGVIEEIFVENGQIVAKGDELFKVQSSATEQEKQAAYSTYLTAQTTLNNAKSALNTYQSAMLEAWDTYKTLAENDTYENADGTPKNDQRTLPAFHIAQKNWLAAEAKYKDQQTAIAQGQAQTASTWILYQATQNSTVWATITGTVPNLSVTKGNSVNIKSITNTIPVLSITNFSSTEVVLALSESNIAKVKKGQKAVIDVKPVKEKEYEGVVERVDFVGTDSSGVIKYFVYIKVLNPDDNLRPGMTADVDIKTQELINVLVVPNSTIKPYQGEKAVRVVDKVTKQIKYIPVTVGIKGENKTQVLKGIDEGQEVIQSLSNEQIKRPSLF